MPYQELYDQGIDRYLGAYTPMTSEVDGNTTVHTFGTGDGPLCQDEGPYIMSTRETGSEDLVIFLQGGGACWSELCLSTETATPGIPIAGVLNPDQANNPMKDWNVAYFNYCDGGLHASDRDWGAVDGPLNNRKQRGLHNLSAGLDVTARTFPQPRRIVLTGSSGGGFGTIFALPLVRALYPDTPIDVLNRRRRPRQSGLHRVTVQRLEYERVYSRQLRPRLLYRWAPDTLLRLADATGPGPPAGHDELPAGLRDLGDVLRYRRRGLPGSLA
jgi:hypothetical protein